VLAVLEELDATPADGVYVGDALADLECSRAAGVLFALAAWGDDVAGLRELKPDVVLEKPDDLLALAGVDHH
jgi:phosphoglycolate phosphatase-like HAD superfamily hydrolase